MNEKKKPGCLWRVAKFTLFTLVILAVAGYFLCWYVPAFKLTPERIGWTLPEGVEVPLTADGKYVDHARAFELTYPEFYANPHKNGWRKVMMAVSPEYFLAKARHIQNAHEEFKSELLANWHARQNDYYRRLDIRPEEIGDFVPTDMAPEVEKAICRDFFREVQAFAAAYPELQVTDKTLEDIQDTAFREALERAGTRKDDLYAIRKAHGYLIRIDPAHFPQEFEEFADLRVPLHLINHYPDAVDHQLRSVAWRAEDYPELAAWVESQSPFWDIVAQAARQEVFYPPQRLDETGLSISLEMYDFLRNTVRGLTLRCAMRHGSGDIAGALADVETLVILGRKLQQTPSLSIYHMGNNIESSAWSVVMNNLGSGVYSREDLAFLTDLKENGRVTRQWVEFLPESKMMAYQMAEKPNFTLIMFDDRARLGAPVIRHMPINANRVMDETIACMGELEKAESFAGVDAEIDAYLKKRDGNPDWMVYWSLVLTSRRTKEYAMMVKWSIPGDSVTSHYCQFTGERDALLRAGIACQRYRLDKGEFPETLEALVPEYLAEVPEEAFRPGEKIKYRVEDDGVVIYAAWYDGEDHGGLWTEDTDLGQYERMKGVEEEVYLGKWDMILRLRK